MVEITRLALDHGEKRIGVALAKGGFVRALPALDNSSELFSILLSLCEEERVEEIILGLPEKPQREVVTNFVQKLKEHIPLPILLWDEAFTSVRAQQLAIDAGLKRSKRKHLDSQAATILLEEYLEHKKNPN